MDFEQAILGMFISAVAGGVLCGVFAYCLGQADGYIRGTQDAVRRNEAAKKLEKDHQHVP